MLDPRDPFYVVTIGRSYMRYEPEHHIIGQSLQHARKFETIEEARPARDYIRVAIPNGKKVGIQRVHIQAVV